MSNEVITIRVFVRLANQGANISTEVEIPRGEWDAMSEDERMNEAREVAMEYIDYGYDVVNNEGQS